MIVLLFVVYEVYITDIFGAQKQAEAKTQLEEIWLPSPDDVGAPGVETAIVTAPAQAEVDPEKRKPTYDVTLGDAFALIFIPAFGADYSRAIIEGTNPDDLYVGPGHYPDSQLPGEKGNFAVAGHRVSKGSPFNELGSLNSCDAIVIETKYDWFVYRVLPMQEEVATWNPRSNPKCADVKVQKDAYQGVFGREITTPSDIAQVYAIPHSLTSDVSQATQRLITLTTCHPQFSDAERMIVHGVLVKSYAKSEGFLPPELGEV
ncbi:class E sortase [Nakamurella silvestris]|nr:class E sortase [Nakamurella silvestris]